MPGLAAGEGKAETACSGTDVEGETGRSSPGSVANVFVMVDSLPRAGRDRRRAMFGSLVPVIREVRCEANVQAGPVRRKNNKKQIINLELGWRITVRPAFYE